MLTRRHQYFAVTPSVVEDAARNDIHGAEMIQLLLNMGHLQKPWEGLALAIS
ncbi:hypothetical protein Micbo1qcDRAFT_167699, partial [Microdochium bolleyi]